MKLSAETVIRTIQKAVDAAEKRGVDVTVEISETGFFPSESATVTVTATKQRSADAK